jgi:maltooligosyltrehalose synthase
MDQVCAFARLEQDQAVVVAVPRLVTRLCSDANRPPIGPEIWGKSWMTVPSWSARTHYRNLLTGENLTPSLMEGRHVLSLGEIFQELPVAVLERLT